MTSFKSLFLKIIVPVVFAFLLTPYPRRLGLYAFLFSFDPGMVGLMPAYYPKGEEEWAFNYDHLYGDGGALDATSAKEYRNRLLGQTAIVTGANSGVGFETALALARLGVSLTMACRNPTKCEAAAQKIRQDELLLERAKKDRGIVDPASASDVTTMTVDTSSLKSVRKFCQEFLARTDDGDGSPMPLDMLFLNAGIIFWAEGDSLKLSEDGIENVFATNVVGHHLMYRLLEPSIFRSDKMRKTPARIVLTSSAASLDTRYPYKVATDLETLNNEKPRGMGPYAPSKLAQVLWAKELTSQLDAKANASSDPNSIVYVNSAHPGAVATNIWKSVPLDKLPFGMGKLIENFMEAATRLMWTSEEGALTLVYLGTAIDDIQTKKIRGKYFHPQSILIEDHPAASDKDPETKILQEKLWTFLEDLVADFL